MKQPYENTSKSRRRRTGGSTNCNCSKRDATFRWHTIIRFERFKYYKPPALPEVYDSTCGPEYRLFDATTVKEPGKTGSIWRIHYSVKIPSLECDFFKITLNKGQGSGEDFSQFPIEKGDHILADAGYSRSGGIGHASAKGAFLCFRINTHSLIMVGEDGERFPLKKRLEEIDAPGNIGRWHVSTPGQDGRLVQGSLCVLKKSQEAKLLAEKKLRRKASRKGTRLNPETLFYAGFVMIFTTFPEEAFEASAIMELYRARWQVELVFKRFKQITQLGHLPKHDPESAKAWLYGKLLTALLTEKMITYAGSISPWGYPMGKRADSKPLA